MVVFQFIHAICLFHVWIILHGIFFHRVPYIVIYCDRLDGEVSFNSRIKIWVIGKVTWEGIFLEGIVDLGHALLNINDRKSFVETWE